jgi:FAD/FMN-containing dehydrogenase
MTLLDPGNRNEIANYDGSISTLPQVLVRPSTITEIQSILRDGEHYPSPVRAMGSYHSLTPCVSTEGTIIDMSRMTRILGIDWKEMTFTAEAGVQVIDASAILRRLGLQLMTNIEIGNMTLGAAACCQSKDALDGVQFGQFNSYVTDVKWVTPNGELAEASERDNLDLLTMVRSSYGLIGVIYQITFRIKPVEAVHFSYLPRPIKDLTDSEVDDIIDASEGLICWTIGRRAHFQSRRRVPRATRSGRLLASARRRLWSRTEAAAGRFIDRYVPTKPLKNFALDTWFSGTKLTFSALHLTRGFSLYDPDKTVDYRSTPPSAKYAFTFWTFTRHQWLSTLREYLEFSEDYFRKHGFRCNMALGSYYIRKDTRSILSYSYDGDMFSIDPIHAYTNRSAWHEFLQRFNEFASSHKGTPLLNQSPFVNKHHVEAAYGERWGKFADWIKSADPNRRMLNQFFADLLD